MKIAILTRHPKNYSNNRLRQVCKEHGHKVRMLDPFECTLFVEEGGPKIEFRGKPLTHQDVVIPRIAASIAVFGAAVVRQFEQMGVFCVNSSQSINVSRDKLRTIQVLSRHNIGIPQTAFVREKTSVPAAIAQVGGPPVIIKLLQGTQGIGVILAEHAGTAQAILETLQTTNQSVLVQSFVSESRGKDIRAFVVGGRVVAAMRRTAQGDEFRSNVHRGGKTEPVVLSPDYERTALQAAQILGLRVAGVDMLEGADGPKVMEVNSSPGLEGIEKATGIDVASAIVQHIEEQVEFPDIDIRQRLTLKHGYGVAEITVRGKSAMGGKSIQTSGLRQREVIVLSINRRGVVFPNPQDEQILHSGDVLLVYGKLATIRSLMPRRTRRSKTD